MKHSLILWASALLLTFLTGYFHNGTSKYYPVTGTIGIDEKKVSYRFEKIFNDKGDYTFIIRTDNPDIEAILNWKKENEDKWNSVLMEKDETALKGNIPRQNAGEKVHHYAEIIKDEKVYTVPDKPVILLFQGYVPSMISFLSNFALFGGLLLSFRTGLSGIGGLKENQKIKKLTLFTVGFFFVYTIAVTPLRKSYEVNAINNKVVPITSLFDLQSILLLITWIAAMVVVFKMKNPKSAALVFAFITVVIFLYLRF